MKVPAITTSELQSRLQSRKDLILLNVLPEIYFNRERIPGSINLDGYKMDFIAELEKTGIKKDTAIVVYASGGDCEASASAAERMLQHGWSKTLDYHDGLAGWKNAGLPLQATAPAKIPAPKTTFTVDTAQSIVHWSGRNLNSIHTGTLKLREGRLDFTADQSLTGNVVMDMNSLADTDLADPAWNQMLVAHLKSGDFFDVAQYPTAQIVIKHSERTADPGTGVPNLRLTADLSIKDVTRELVFPATLVIEEDGTLKAHAHFDFDRTLWNVKYGSAKFFKLLGMHLVDDLVSLDMKLVAR
jgi:polyisoprenoid-binding protein YceI